MKINGVGKLTVEVSPSEYNGLFLGLFGRETIFGKTADIFGVSDEDKAAMQWGDPEALAKYVQHDPSRPGYYALLGCHVSISVDEWKYAGVNVDSLMEVVPYMPEPIELPQSKVALTS